MADKAVTVRPAGGTYTTLDAAIDGELVANAVLTAAGLDGVLTITIEGDWSAGADTLPVNITGFTADATHYLIVQTDSSNRAGTTWSASKYRLVAAVAWGNIGCNLSQNYVRVTGIQMGVTQGSNHAGAIIVYNEHGCLIDSCLLANSTVDDWAALIWNGGGSIVRSEVRNCVIANIVDGGVAGNGIYMTGAVTNGQMDNCTVMNVGGDGILCEESSGLVRNCYSGGNVGNDFTMTAGTITTCFSEDGTAATTVAAYSTDNFANVTDGTEDAALVAGSDLINGATDLSADAAYPFDWDINDATRVAWDVGADEYVAAAGGQPAIKRFGGVPHMAVNIGVW